MMQTIKSLWLKIAISLGFGILTGSGFVALHFSAESETFHLSQFWESVTLSAVGTAFWLCLCQTAMAMQSYCTSSPRRLRLAWYGALYASVAIGLLIAGFLGYSAFMGEERDWFKVHERFVLSEYIAVSVELGLFYGALAATVCASVASALLAVLALIKKWSHRSTAVG